METTTITTIQGYSVELELYEENGEQRSDCTVSKGDLSSSMELLDHLGGFEDDTGQVFMVPRSAILAIRKWADANGY